MHDAWGTCRLHARKEMEMDWAWKIGRHLLTLCRPYADPSTGSAAQAGRRGLAVDNRQTHADSMLTIFRAYADPMLATC